MIKNECGQPRDADGDGGAAVRRTLMQAQRDLLSYLVRRLSNAGDAQEALQQFVLRVLERSNDLRDVRTVRGWLARVLATTTADWQRRRARIRRRHVAMEETELAALTAALDPDADRAVCGCLYKVLPTLRRGYADIIWRADLLEEPRQQIVASPGTSVNNVTIRLHRGRRALKRRLEETCLACPEDGFLDCGCEPDKQVSTRTAMPK